VRTVQPGCENEGPERPNNEGLRRANGDIVAYLGHDDLWLPNHLRLLVHAIDGDVGFVYGKTLSVGTRWR
jgi:glycosyltransferase involved in cell wall biosynthesis